MFTLSLTSSSNPDFKISTFFLVSSQSFSSSVSDKLWDLGDSEFVSGKLSRLVGRASETVLPEISESTKNLKFFFSHILNLLMII